MADPPFSPKSLGGLVLWLRGDLGVTLNPPTLTFPDALDNAAWTKNGATVTPDATLDPFGTSLADSLIEDGTLGVHSALQVAGSWVNGLTATVTWYVKAGTRSFVHVGTTNEGSWFNVGTGALGTNDGSTARSITAVAGFPGWFLLSVTITPTSSSVRLYMGSADNTPSYQGDGVSNVFAIRAEVSQPKVSAWADQSGLGNNVSQGTAANQPLWEAASFGGKPAVLTDGVNDNLRGTGASMLAVINGTQKPFTYAISGQFVTQVASAEMFAWSQSSSGLDFERFRLDAGPANYVTDRRDDGATVVSGIGPASGTAQHGWIHVMPGTTSSLFTDNAARGGDPTAYSNGVITNIDNFMLGAGDFAGPAGFSNSRIAEVIVYNRALSAADRARLYSYQKARYGTP